MLQRSDPNYLTLVTHYSNTSHTTQTLHSPTTHTLHYSHTNTLSTQYSHYWHTHTHLTHCSNTVQICRTKKRTNSHLCPRDACQPQGKAHMRAGLLCTTRISPAHTALLIFVRYTIFCNVRSNMQLSRIILSYYLSQLNTMCPFVHCLPLVRQGRSI